MPTNVGFWLRELLDARYAGMQFMMPNVYGPDVQPSTGEVADLEAALTAIDAMGGGMKVGLFNDTWAWGKAQFGTLMNPAPVLANTAAAAQRIYSVEWQPFFEGISKAHWYTVEGKPLIYFYNAGTLTPTTGFNAVLAQMKQLFQNEFGVSPFVVVDRGFGAAPSGDGQFVWDTFMNYPTTNMGTAAGVTGGLTFDNSMVKWDSLGRDMPGAIANATTQMYKGPQILSRVLEQSSGAGLQAARDVERPRRGDGDHPQLRLLRPGRVAHSRRFHEHDSRDPVLLGALHEQDDDDTFPSALALRRYRGCGRPR